MPEISGTCNHSSIARSRSLLSSCQSHNPWNVLFRGDMQKTPQWDDTAKIAHIRALLAEQEPVRQDAEACLAPVKQELERALTEEDYHKILEARSIRIQHRATPILKALAWQGEADSLVGLRR